MNRMSETLRKIEELVRREGRRSAAETTFMTTRHTKLVREGVYVAEVDVDLIQSDQPWAPYLSLVDVRKLDEVRTALKRGDVAPAVKIARVYRLTPVTAA
jgi:hypothetical protein